MSDPRWVRTKGAKRIKALDSTNASFDLKLPIIPGTASRKMLLVLDYVPREDIKDGHLLQGDTGQVFRNICNYASWDLPEIFVVNFSDYKVNTLNGHDRDLAFSRFADRVQAICAKYNPDLVLFSGSDAADALLGRQDSRDRMGRIMRAKLGGRKRRYLTTLSLSMIGTSNPKDFKKDPNLIGVFLRHFETACEGKNRYTIDTKNVKRIFIRDRVGFDRFFKQLKKASIVSIDTEGINLNRRWGGRLLSMQFAMGPKTAYFLPMFHRESPWSKEDFDYITRKLRWYFESGKSHYHVYQNAKYDVLQILSDMIGVRWYNHLVWDISAGEYSLDENLKFLQDKGVSVYSLGALTFKYGSNMYDTGIISKEDRANMEKFSLEEIEDYGYKDVIGPYQICQFQQAEAQRRGEDYAGYFNAVVHQIGTMILDYADMEHNGIRVDRKYLVNMCRPDSIFAKSLAEVNDSFRKSKAAQKVNKMLLKRAGVPEGNFGLYARKPDEGDTWVFDIGKPLTQQLLFFQVLKLDGLRELKKEGQWAVDKFFHKANMDVPEVAAHAKYNKFKKLKGTFIEGILKQLTTNPDAKRDGRLRPNFHYLKVVTGRGSSDKPNFQQIPSRGDMAKLIKRQFIISGAGFFIVKADFSAHEVRNWGNISGDKRVAGTFRVGLQLRRELRLLSARHPEAYQAWLRIKEQSGYHKKDDKKQPLLDNAAKVKLVKGINDRTVQRIGHLETELEVKGDIHLLNYEFFYGTPPDQVTPTQRQSIKQVVFGVIYGKGPASLAEDIKGTKEEAAALIKKLYEKFAAGGKWIKRTIAKGRRDATLVGPTGRVRHLWGMMHHDQGVLAQGDRQGPNSLVQGPSSDMGFQGMREMRRLAWEYCIKRGKGFSMAPENAVHDSTQNEVHFVDLPLALYFIEHGLTTRVHKKMREVFGFRFEVDLEIDFELSGFSEGDTMKWDMIWSNLPDVVRSGLALAEKELGYKTSKREWRQFEHNLKIIEALRTRELKQDLKRPEGEVSELMLITNEIIDSLHFSGRSIDESMRQHEVTSVASKSRAIAKRRKSSKLKRKGKKV